MSQSFRRPAVAALVLAAVLACAETTEPEPASGPPARIQRLLAPSSAVAGDVLDVSVRVTDREGRPVPDAEVRWIAADGSGVIAVPSNLTDGDGVARAEWWLGLSAKTYTLSAHALQGSGASKVSVAVTTFTIAADPRPATEKARR